MSSAKKRRDLSKAQLEVERLKQLLSWTESELSIYKAGMQILSNELQELKQKQQLNTNPDL